MVKIENLASSTIVLNFKRGLKTRSLGAGSSITLSPFEFSFLVIPEPSIMSCIKITRYNITTKEGEYVLLSNPTTSTLNVRFEKNGKEFGKNINPKSSVLIETQDYACITEMDSEVIIENPSDEHKIDFWSNVAAFESGKGEEIPKSCEPKKLKPVGFQLPQISVSIPKSDTKVAIKHVSPKKKAITKTCIKKSVKLKR